MDSRDCFKMGPWEWLMLLALSMLWGGAFFFNEVLLRELHPLVVVLGRVSLAAALLWIVILAGGSRPRLDLRTWGAFAVMGFLNNLLPFSLIVWGQTHMGGGLAAILNATTPLFSLFAVRYLGDGEPITRLKAGGLLLGLAGVGVLLSPELGEGVGSNLLAQLAVLGAAVSYALAGVFGRRFKDQPPLFTAAGQLTGSAVMMAVLVFLIGVPWPGAWPQAGTWAALLGSAFLATALAYILYFRILQRSGATNVLLVTLLIPVSAMLLGGLFLGELIQGRHLAGMGLIAAALAAVDGRLPRALAQWFRAGAANSKNQGLDQ